MLRSTSNNQHPRKWAIALRREMQMAIGQQLRDECELPQELPPELSACELPQELPPELSARLIRKDKEHDRYADIVGTC
jgi:hypothetical protein